MNISMILEMAATNVDRAVVTSGDRSLTGGELFDHAHTAANRFREYPAVLYLGTNHLAYPIALFGAALAGVPFVVMACNAIRRGIGACAGIDAQAYDDLDGIGRQRTRSAHAERRPHGQPVVGQRAEAFERCQSGGGGLRLGALGSRR